MLCPRWGLAAQSWRGALLMLAWSSEMAGGVWAPSLGLETDQLAAEHYRAAAWALWHGQRLTADLSSAGRVQRYAALDHLTQTLRRGDAPAVIDVYNNDGTAGRGTAYQTWRSALSAAADSG